MRGVGKFVEFYGEGAANLSLADRCPVANMSPEYGATMGFFAVDEKTIEYLKETGRSDEQCELVELYCKHQGLWGFNDEPNFNEKLEQTVEFLKKNFLNKDGFLGSALDADSELSLIHI